tara:strand:+ start:103 stop:1098 length:996 start_codon:yes stop_codon:yes gene_type:complete
MATALIDADIVAYRAAAVSQEDIDWKDGHEGVTLSRQQALESAEHILKEWTHGARCKKAILCFTCKDNFRKEIYPAYKSNRKGDPPELLGEVIAYLQDKYESYSVSRLEADDVMSIYATSEFIKSAVIVSIDKDMKTVPAMIFNPDKDAVPWRNRVVQADRWWMMQTLMGDTSDGFPGIPGIGPKKAEKILAESRSTSLISLWGTVVSAYRDAGLTEDDAITQARLARILRAEDFNKEKKEIVLWHPTNPSMMSIVPATTSLEESNPSISSQAEDSPSQKETSSNTSVDGDGREGRKTSRKRRSTSKGLSRKPRKRRSSLTSTFQSEGQPE